MTSSFLLAVPANHEYNVKVKEGEKQLICVDLTREVKSFGNMKLTVIPVIVGRLGTVANDHKKDWMN